MSMKHALQTILLIALGGVAFSGVLSYRELSSGVAPCSVGSGGTGSMFGIPVCVFGLVMYVAIAIIAGLGLLGERRHTHAYPA